MQRWTRAPLTYIFKWNEVLNGSYKESCEEQLDAQRDGTLDPFNDCLDEAILMFNPEMVERLSSGFSIELPLPQELYVRLYAYNRT